MPDESRGTNNERRKRCIMDSFLWALGAACVWGIVPVLEKLGLKGVPPLTGLFYRCLGVVAGLFVLAAFITKPSHLKAAGGKTIALLIMSGFLASFVAQILFYNALKDGHVSRVVPVSASYPLIAALLGILFLKEPVSVPKIVGMGLIVGGVWLLK